MFASNTSQVANDAVFIEDTFSTTLYTGNNSTQTITNGIDLAGEGGLVWIKNRTISTYHDWFDTARGAGNFLFSNTTDANINSPGYDLTAFNSNGFSLGPNGFGGNANGYSYASWTFRKQPKFFDVVTYTGNGVAGRQISHALGSVPGCIIIKVVTSPSIGSSDWVVYHRSLGATKRIFLNTTGAEGTSSVFWNNTEPTATHFTLGTEQDVNKGDGTTYVAYLFAHDAGGFGLTGTDNVISCGSFTTDSSGNATVSLGYEPQWVLIKASSTTGSWRLMDNMRGMPVTANSSTTTGGRLYPNFANADDGFPSVIANATGFVTVPGTVGNSETNIYIAIRRGPMKTPTSGTSVFALGTSTSDTSGYTLTSNFPVDSYWYGRRTGGSQFGFMERLTNARLFTASTGAEGSVSGYVFWDSNVNVRRTALLGNASTSDYALGRAPGFFDEVCFNGVDSGTKSVSHNLQAVPELIITKARNDAVSWYVYSATLGINKWLRLNAADAEASSAGAWGSTPTASAFTATTTILVSSATNYVAYLFASAPGVSKVGSYTGTGTTQQINCGFTAGARFVLIKRTDSTGDWYVWDSARGIVAGNDPYLLLNSTAAEVTSTDYVDTYSAGFEISSTAPAAINANGGSFIFFAVA